MTSSDESDVEMPTAFVVPRKKMKNPLRSPTEDMLKKNEAKKVSTKIMVHKALTELKSRKGVSLHAIKKNMEDNYQVDTKKLNQYIKRYIATAVETGSIIQVKGIGATGSFRLAAAKEKAENKEKAAKPKVKEMDMLPQVKRIKIGVEKNIPEKKVTMKKPMLKEKPEKAKRTKTTEVEEVRATKTNKSSKVEKDVKIKKMMKKRGEIKKRKSSIGSIIKPPKMKPKRPKT